MSVILKENEWAAKQIAARSLGKKPSETLRRVARYYMDQGYSTKDVRNKLDVFLLQCDRTASLPKWSDALDYAVSRAAKRKAVDIDGIDVTDTEMEWIDALSGKQIKRLAFTLLCLAKYGNAINPENHFWVNHKDNEIMSMANINTSIKRQGQMYQTLRDEGMVQFSRKVDNTNVRVCFADDGIPAMRVADFRNLGYQYMMYHGEPYFECANCGVTTKINNPKNNRKPKYCNECATKVHTQQSVNSVMRRRYPSAADADTDLGIYTVYMIQCPNDKRYIGTTGTSLNRRWGNGYGYIYNEPFYKDIEKYGWENLRFYQIAVTQDRELAKDIESFYVRKYKTSLNKHGYNRASERDIHRFDKNIADTYTMTEVDKNGNILT